MGKKTKRSGSSLEKNMSQAIVVRDEEYDDTEDDIPLRELLQRELSAKRSSSSSRTRAAVSEPSEQLVEVAVHENGLKQRRMSTRRTQRLQNATSSAVDAIRPAFGQVEVYLNCGEGSSTGKKGSAAEELAAGNIFSLEDLISEAENRRKTKAEEYKQKYEDTQAELLLKNRQIDELARKYECQNARQEGYHLGQQSVYGVLDKLKDVLLYSSQAKRAERLLELPSTSNGSDTLMLSPPGAAKPSPVTRSQAAAKAKNLKETP